MAVTLFFAVWTAITAFLWAAPAPLIFPIVFGFFDVLIFLGVVDSWLGSARIDADRDGLELAGGMITRGTPVRIATADIESITAATGQVEGAKTQQQVTVRTKDGKTHRAGRPLVDRYAAQVLADLLSRSIRR
jgi:hypothetical protein